MKVKLTQEEIDTMSYDDVAFLILEAYGKKMKTPDLFTKVIKVMSLPEEEFSRGIGDFFELLITDKRFVMLENGFWDLKTNHSTKVVFDDEDDEDELDLIDTDDEDESEIEEDDTEINYDEDNIEDDDEDELQDLVIIDETDENDDLV